MGLKEFLCFRPRSCGAQSRPLPPSIGPRKKTHMPFKERYTIKLLYVNSLLLGDWSWPMTFGHVPELRYTSFERSAGSYDSLITRDLLHTIGEPAPVKPKLLWLAF